MVLSRAVNSIDLVTGRNNNTGGSVELSRPQLCDFSESEDGRSAMRLPNMDKRKPLEKDAKDLTDLDSDQQQQQPLLSSTFPSSSSTHHKPTKVSLPPSQQIKDLRISFETSSSRGPRRRGANLGIKAARQRFLLEKAAKHQETEAAYDILKAGYQTSEMSSESSAPLLNLSSALTSSSSMSSTSRQKAAPQPVVRLPSQSLFTQNSTSKTTIANDFCDRPFSHGRPNGVFQQPLPQLSSSSSYLSSARTGHSHRIQDDWATGEHLFIKVCDLPDSTTVRDLWTAFECEGHIAHIRLYEDAKGRRDGNASVKFRYASKIGSRSLLTWYSPPPAKAFWERGRYSIQLSGGRRVSVRVYNDTRQRLILPVHSMSKYPETMVRCLSSNTSSPTNVPQTLYAESVDFGVMFDQTTMMNMRTVVPTRDTGIKFRANTFRKEISVEFPMHIVDPRTTSNNPSMQRGKHDRTELFQFRIPFTQLKVVHRIAGQEYKLILLISMEIPPKFFKQLDPSKSQDAKALTWADNDAWYRQTDLVYDPNGLKKSSLTWRKPNPIIDLGKHESCAFDLATDLSKDAGLLIVSLSIFRRMV